MLSTLSLLVLVPLGAGLVWTFHSTAVTLLDIDLGLTTADMVTDLADGFERRDG